MRTSFTAMTVVAIALSLCGAARADVTSLPPKVATEIAAMGPKLNPDVIGKSFALMRPLVPAPDASVKVAKDVHYGDDALQTIDVYQPARGRDLPIAIYVHGGGFVRGDKADYNNVVAYFAAHGIVGVNANYRLAPKVTWPAESEDVGAAVAFVKKHAAEYGGDPNRVILIGHSAGAHLVGAYVLNPSLHPAAGPGIAGAVVISIPAYRAASISEADQVYLGKDKSEFAKRVPASFVQASKTPLFIIMTQYDPPGLAPESYAMAEAICVRDGQCPRFLYVNGHNHITEVASIGSKDDQLGRALVDFIETTR